MRWVSADDPQRIRRTHPIRQENRHVPRRGRNECTNLCHLFPGSLGISRISHWHDKNQTRSVSEKMGAFLTVCKHNPSWGANHEAAGRLASTTRKQTMAVLVISSSYSVQDPDYPMSPFCPHWGCGFWPQLNISGNAITDCLRGFSPRWFKYYRDDKVQILVCFLASLSISETSTWNSFVYTLALCVFSSGRP